MPDNLVVGQPSFVQGDQLKKGCLSTSAAMN